MFTKNFIPDFFYNVINFAKEIYFFYKRNVFINRSEIRDIYNGYQSDRI